MPSLRKAQSGGGLVASPAGPAAPSAAARTVRAKPRGSSWWHRHRFQLLALAPSMLALFIFVYGFIAYTIRVSLSKWQGIAPNLELEKPIGKTYQVLMQTPRFQADLRNTLVFTALFLILAVVGGLLLAIFVHDTLIGRGFFRSIFLFPYAL